MIRPVGEYLGALAQLHRPRVDAEAPPLELALRVDVPWWGEALHAAADAVAQLVVDAHAPVVKLGEIGRRDG